jgi:DNA-binding response OmpR family regulator
VESLLGEGSRFRIRLPVSRRADLAEAFSPDQITEMVPADIYKENGFRLPDSLKKGPNQNVILVVEDNRDVAAYLESVLSGFEVRVCYNGREGLEMAQNIIPDMIVCDIMMPEMDGLALCRILKADKRTNHIPVILLTAKADTASRMEGLEAGADAYLTKPFRREEILLRIGKMIELRQKMQERYRDLAFLFQAETVASPKGNTAEDQFLREVHQIIETHLSDPDLNVEAICRELGMGRTQLFQKFKALTGQTISDFIRKTRLYKARHLLKNTSLNVSEIAGEVGFRSLSTFSRNYRAEFGMNPSEVKNGG